MKKTLVILLILAVAGGVFAQDINFGGQVYGRAELAKGSNQKGILDEDTIRAGGAWGRIRLEASGQNEEETFGGWARFQSTSGNYADVVSAYAYAWWQPLDMLKLTLGNNGGDGFFGADGTARWAFYDEAGDVGIARENWNWGSSFYAGFAVPGAWIAITPIEPLAINIAIPFMQLNNAQLVDMYLSTTVQVAYTLDGIGKFAVTYASGPGWNTRKSTPHTIDTGALWAYFNLAMIENLSLDFGVGYKLPGTLSETTAGGLTFKTSQVYPLAVGAAAKMDITDQFGFKARAQAKFMGSQKVEFVVTNPVTGVPYVDSRTDKEALVVEGDVLPYFAINDEMTVFMSVGAKYTAEVKRNNVTTKSSFGWHVNPYLRYRQGKGTFYAGAWFGSDGVETAYTDPNTGLTSNYKLFGWAIPIGIAYSF